MKLEEYELHFQTMEETSISTWPCNSTTKYKLLSSLKGGNRIFLTNMRKRNIVINYKMCEPTNTRKLKVSSKSAFEFSNKNNEPTKLNQPN